MVAEDREVLPAELAAAEPAREAAARVWSAPPLPSSTGTRLRRYDGDAPVQLGFAIILPCEQVLYWTPPPPRRYQEISVDPGGIKTEFYRATILRGAIVVLCAA